MASPSDSLLCPVCSTPNHLQAATCPGCGADLSLLQMLYQLPPSPLAPQQLETGVETGGSDGVAPRQPFPWRLGVAILFLGLGIGLGWLLKPTPRFPRAEQPRHSSAADSPGQGAKACPPPTLTPSQGSSPSQTNPGARQPPTPARSAMGVAIAYRIIAGDTLSDLAYRFYGDPSRWPNFLGVNPQLGDRPDFLKEGEVIIIPGLASPGGENSAGQ